MLTVISGMRSAGMRKTTGNMDLVKWVNQHFNLGLPNHASPGTWFKTLCPWQTRS